MRVRCTSVAAYRDLQAQGKDNTERARIIRIVACRANMSAREIQRVYERKYGRLDVGTISARVKGLKDDGVLVEEVYPRKCTISHRSINPVRIVPEQITEAAQ